MQVRHVGAFPLWGVEGNNVCSMLIIFYSSTAPRFDGIEINFLALAESSLRKLWRLNDVDSGREYLDSINCSSTALTGGKSALSSNLGP